MSDSQSDPRHPDAWFDRVAGAVRRRAREQLAEERHGIERCEQDLAALHDPAELRASTALLEQEITELKRVHDRLAGRLAELRARCDRRRRAIQSRLTEAAEAILAAHRSHAHRQVIDDAASLFDEAARRATSRVVGELSPRELEAFLADVSASGLPDRARDKIWAKLLEVWESTRLEAGDLRRAGDLEAENAALRQRIETRQQDLARQHQLRREVLEAVLKLGSHALQRLREDALAAWLERVLRESSWDLPRDVMAGDAARGGGA